LGGEDEEGVWEKMGLAHDRDAALLHGLKKGGLGLGGGAVDFVGEDQVGEERAGLKDEAAAGFCLLEHGIAGDVAWEEVGGELDAFGIEAKGLGKTFDEFGFAETGEAFKEDVTTCKETGEDVLNERILAEENAAQGLSELVDLRGSVGGFDFGEGMVHGLNVEL
jgi:hypothetical protein